MNDKEILEKAIQKGIDGGWQDAELAENATNDNELMGILLSSDFAKALWGDDGFTTIGLKCSTHEGVTRYWQYHLQNMVIAPDPIKYLGDNL